jgi:plasmid stabilization system protein ParE
LIQYSTIFPRIHRKAQNVFRDASKASLACLVSHPDIGIRTDDPTIRRLAIPPYPYLVFYEITETEIIIHAVRHAARNPFGMPGSA